MEKTIGSTDRCKEWVRRDEAVIAPCQHLRFYDLVVERSQGDLLYDADGNEFIDFYTSASSLNLGSGFPIIMDAIQRQMEKCVQYTAVYSYNAPMIEYAERLVSIFPKRDPNQKIKLSYSNCGSEANDAAVKFSRGFTHRQKIITFVDSYHGNTYGASTLTACTAEMHEGIAPMLPEVYHFPFYGIDVDSETCRRDCLKEIKKAFETYLPANDVAAVIIEPMQGDGGMLPAHPIFMQELYALCQKNGILLIAEEVQQAFYRTGMWFSISNYLQYGVYPDGIIMGKSIGGGLVSGAFMARAEIIDSLKPPAHIFTLAGNHLSCAAGIALFDYMNRPEFANMVQINSEWLAAELQKVKENFPDVVSFARGLGMSYGVGIVKPGTQTPDPDGAFKIVYRAYEYGLALISLAGNVLRIQPPLNISKENMVKGIERLQLAIRDYAKGMIPDSVLENRKGWSGYTSAV